MAEVIKDTLSNLMAYIVSFLQLRYFLIREIFFISFDLKDFLIDRLPKSSIQRSPFLIYGGEIC